MTLMNFMDSDTRSVTLDVTGGREAVSASMFSSELKMYYSLSMPGIVWFDRSGREFEVVDYEWSGPRFQDVMIQDNNSNTQTHGGRKGRLAGALIGTLIAPGIGTVIGAAVGTGRKENSNTRGQTISHVETREVPVAAYLHLRNLDTDDIVQLSFRCDSQLDATIRNHVAINLTSLDYDPQPQIISIPEHTEKKEDAASLLAQLKELKELLDAEAITEEEYAVLKKKLME